MVLLLHKFSRETASVFWRVRTCTVAYCPCCHLAYHRHAQCTVANSLLQTVSRNINKYVYTLPLTFTDSRHSIEIVLSPATNLTSTIGPTKGPKMNGISSLLIKTLAIIGTVLLTAGVLEYAGLRTRGSIGKLAFPVAIQNQQESQSFQPWCSLTMAAEASAKPLAQAAAHAPSAGFPVSPFPASFWFVKTVKTGSSTLTSVFHSICSHYGIQWLKTDIARMVVGIGKPKADTLAWVQQQLSNLTDGNYLAITNHMVYNQDVADIFRPAMLFTTVRHPLGRVHSHFVQDACVAAAKALGWDNKLTHREEQDVGPNACDGDPEFLAFALQNDSVDARWEFAQSKSAMDQVYNYIRGDKSSVTDVANQYDFIFTAERMNEGLVMFMLKYGLTFEDIAYLPLKVRKGRYKTASDMPQELNDFIMANNAKDLQLWEIANSRLDQHKVLLQQQCRLGIVNTTLAAFEQLLDEVHADCSQYVDWYAQHSFGGPYTYTGLANIAFDSGNGYRCVRHVARRFMVAGPRHVTAVQQKTASSQRSTSSGTRLAEEVQSLGISNDNADAAYPKGTVRPTRLM